MFSGERKRLAIIGSNSRLARAVSDSSTAPIFGISRHSKSFVSNEDCAVLKSYDELRAKQLEHCKTALYCIGTHQGDRDLMMRVNCHLAVELAKKARDAGVEHFIYLSSFSVYGAQGHIIDNSNLSADTDYGWSRLEAENRLIKFAEINGSPQFAVSILRLPMLYGFGDSKLEKLLHMISRTRLFIKPERDVRRSMLHYHAAARVINHLMLHPAQSPIAVADEVPFSYALVQEAAEKMMRHIRMPAFSENMVALMSSLMPSLIRSLYLDSYLDPAINGVASFGLETRLFNDVASLLAREGPAR